MLKHDVTEWRAKYINTGDSDIHVGAWWDWSIRLVIVQSVVLMGWWLNQTLEEGHRWDITHASHRGRLAIQTWRP